jgi:hypothetical protein
MRRLNRWLIPLALLGSLSFLMGADGCFFAGTDGGGVVVTGGDSIGDLFD